MEMEKNIAAAREKEAREAQQREATQRKQAEAVAGMLESMFHRLDPHDAKYGGADLRADLTDELQKMAATLNKDQAMEPVVRSRLRDSLGWTLSGLGESSKSVALLESAIAERKASGAADDAAGYRMLYHLGFAYTQADRELDAIKAFERAHAWQAANLGADNRETLATLLQVANGYRNLGRYTDAVRLLQQVRDRQIAAFGPDDPDTLRTLRALATTYGESGRTAEAIKLFEHVRDRQAEKLGADSVATLITECRLAQEYQSAGKGTQAVALLTQVRDQEIKRLGPEHPDVYESTAALALAYVVIGRQSDAIPILERLRETQIRKMGADHPMTDDTTSHLARMYEGLDRGSDAIQMLEQLRNERIQRLGLSNSATFRADSLLAFAYVIADRGPAAVRLYEDLRDRQMATLGPDDPDVLHTLCMLAQAYINASRTAEAIPILKQVREKNEKRVGPEHNNTLFAVQLLAFAYLRENQTNDAVMLFEQLREIADRQGNVLALRQVAPLLAQAYLNAGRVGEAIELLEQVRDLQLRLVGIDDQRIVRMLSLVYRRAGRLSDALKLAEDVRVRSLRAFGPDHPDSIAANRNLIGLYDNAGRTADALKLSEQAREQTIRAVGLDHNRTFDATDESIHLYEEIGRKEDAAKFREEILPHKVNVKTNEIAISPSNPELHVDRGWLYIDMGKYDLAAVDFSKAIELQSRQLQGRDRAPQAAPLLKSRAMLLAQLGKFNEAIADFQRAAELAPQDHLNWHDGLVPLLLQAGDVQGYQHWRSEELRLFRSTVDDDVAHRVAKDALMVPLEGEDLKIAMELADKALLAHEKTNWSFGPLQSKGMAEYRSGHYARAIAYLIRCRDSTDDPRFIGEAEFVLAMSCQQLGDAGQAQAALQRGIECLARAPHSDAGILAARNPGDWVLGRVLRGEAVAIINGNQAATNPTRGAATASAADQGSTLRELFEHEIAALAPELGQDPARGADQLYYLRGGLCARLGRFQEAASDYAKAIDLKPEDANRWHDGIPLLLQIGDIEGYRRRRSQELTRFKDTMKTDLAHCIAKDAFALPIEGEDLHIAQELAERGLAEPSLGWGAQTKGMAEYRLGHYRQAITYMTESAQVREWAYSKTIADLMLAMSYKQLGDEANARAALERASQKMDREFPKPGKDDLVGANDWVFCQVLRREAEDLISGKGPTTAPVAH
jgi:tetratricopeptide (TPR) repeat protein